MKPRGLSLVEILVVVTIVGIVLVIAWFLLRRGNAELSRASVEAQSLIQRARFEAIKRNKNVLVDIENGGTRLVAAVDSNNTGSNSGTLQADDAPRWVIDLDSYQVRGITFSTINNFGLQSGFRWSQDGLPLQLGGGAAIAPGGITIAVAGQSRRLCLSSAGRVRRVAGSICPG